MYQGHILSIESEMAVRTKMADKNQIFSHNSESIQHFFNLFLYLFGVTKTQISKKSKMAAYTGFSISAAILDFLKNVFPQNLCLSNTK
jgi:hypothetical protein